MKSSDDLERWARALDATGDYRVLHRLKTPEVDCSALGDPSERTAIIVDTETTGLDPRIDQVIELAMIRFTYTPDGMPKRIVGTYSGFNEPTIPLPSEIMALTGISAADLRGKCFDTQSIDKFLEPAALVIAHNAAFDRPFCESITPAFSELAWACSATEVPWRQTGFDGIKLSYLLNHIGYFNDGHRALNDSAAVLKILSHQDAGGAIPLTSLLKSARETRAVIRCHGGYDARKILKARGYRWNADATAIPPHWSLEMPEIALEDELVFLDSLGAATRRSAIIEHQTAYERYRAK